MPYQEFDGELDDDKKKPAGFVEFSGELDEPAPAPKLASGPRQPMGRGFGMPKPAPTPEPLSRPAGMAPTPADLEWQSLSPQGQQKVLDARGIQQQPRSRATMTAAEEPSAFRRAVDSTVRKPLDNSLAGAAVETVGDAARGVGQGLNNLAASGYGLLSAGVNTVAGDDTQLGNWAEASAKKGLGNAAQLTNPVDPESLTSKVFNSVTTNAATMGFLGFGNKALAGMFAQSAGQDYAETAGTDMTNNERLTRSAYMGIAEVVGEKISMPALGALFKANAATTSVKDLGRMLEHLIVKEQLGEQATTALQSAFEKFSPTGKRPDMTMSDYLNEVVETAKVTLGQSLVMGGAGAARTVGSAARRTTNSDAFGAALEADVADKQVPGAPTAPLAPANKAVFTSPTTEAAGLTPIVVNVPQGPPAVPNAQQPGQTAAQGDQTQPVAPTPTQAPATAPAAAAAADADWQQFAPETGTLGVPRAEMPQIKAEHRGALVNFLTARGITHEQAEVPAGELKPTQAEFSISKTEKAKAFEGGERSILVSSDGYILDGHHQALAKADAGEPVKVIRLNAPMSELLPAAREFPSSTLDTSSETAPAASPAVAGAQSAIDRLAAAQDAGIAAAKGDQSGSRVQRAVEQPQPLAATPAVDSTAQVSAGDTRAAEQAPAPASQPTASAPSLTPQETTRVVQLIQDSRLRLKQPEAIKLTPVDPSTSDDADLGIRVSSALGKPVLFVSVQGKSTMNAANVNLGGKQVTVIRADAADSMLALSVHEALHGMDNDVKQELHSALFDGPDAPVTKEHIAKFRSHYPMYADDKVAEEIAAMLAQQEAKRPEFWQRLAEKVGDGNFGKLAKAVLEKLDAITAAFKGSNNGSYTSDIKAVREALTSAYAETARRRGAAPVNEQKQGAEAEVDFAERGKAETVGDYEARAFKDGSIRIAGDADAIRAKLPDGVVGRATKDGLVFTATDAPRVRRALEGNNLAYSRAGEVVEKLPMRGGKYVGAPAKFDTPAKIPHLRKWLMKLTLEGERGRYWYENSSREVLRMVGGDVQEARKFVALLAIYSPQAKVDANSTFALRAWAQYKAGQPISVKTKVMDDKAKAALDDVDAFWSGEKTGNFFHNLLREIDPSTEGKQGATIDMWMMRAGQYDNDAPTATQYAFMENETNRVAAEMGWEPQQVQAAIWVAMKARMENDGVKKRTEASSEKRGWIRFDKQAGADGKLKKVRVILDAQKHRDNWLKHAFEHEPTAEDTAKAKFDFADGLLRHIGQVSFEARPGRSTGVLPGIHDAPYAQQVEFQQAVQAAFLDDQGRDILAHYLGLLVDNDILAPGVWQGEVSPSTQKRVAMAPAKGDAGKSSVDPAQAEALNVYAAVAGLVARQEGVGWHRPFYAGTKAKANGIEIDIGRVLNPREVADLEKAVGKWMDANGKAGWQNQFAFISSPVGIRLVNFGIIENGQLHADIVRAAADVLPDGTVTGFASDGDMPTNDWKEAPNGQAYVGRIEAAGRPDVLDWARSVLAPRVQRVFDDFSERYGWGDAGSIDFSERRRGDGRSADDGRSDRAERADGFEGGGQAAGQRDAASDRRDGGPRRVAGVGLDPATAQALRRLDPLPGAPTVDPVKAGTRAGPDAGLVAVAEAYARQAGIKLTRQSAYADVDEGRARRIAAAYEAMPHAPGDPRVREAYENLIRQTTAQYRALEQAGYQFWLFDEASDPYEGDPWKAMADLRENRSMAVYSTRAGFGTDASFDPKDNPLLAGTGIRWPYGGPNGPLQPVLANDLFRAVHDAFGHGLEGAGFRARGEENAWQAHARLFTGSALGAITSETRGQNSWLNYGPHGDRNKSAKVFDTEFAQQKTGLMPAWAWSEGRLDFSDQARPVLDENGDPEFGNGKVRLMFPIESPRFEYFEQPGERVMAYAIMPADGSFDVLGSVDVVVRDGKPVTLLDIEIYRNAGRGRNNGVGRAAVQALVDASADGLEIGNIVPASRGFWEKLGVPTQNVEGAYDGKIEKAEQPRAGAAQGGEAQGAAREGGRPDAGAEAGSPGSVGPDFANQSSTRETDSWILSRDETGRFRFGAGAKAYRAAAGLANKILGRLAMAPASKELTRYIRQMKQEIAKAQELTVDVANEMSKMSEAERLLISDVVEKELAARITPPAEVLKMAASISAIMGKQTDELVRLGMLSQEAADAWRDRYLPRFYESKLTAGKVKDAWESAVAALTRQPRAIKGINGSSLKRRGMVKTIMAADLADWEAEGWKLDDKSFDPATDIYTQVHRDFTREEREKMGEIRDAMFRFVMGYMRSQKDIALGRMYEKIANDMAHKVPPADGRQWVKVPSTLIEDTKARVYGKLAGKYVPKEVLDHLSQYQAFEDPMLDELFRIYKKGLSMWKEGKTVLNPVSHVNNIVSNLTMAHFAGVSYWDAHKYIGATRDIVRKAPMLQEAKDAGLFGGTFNDAELINSMPEQLRLLAAKAESKIEKRVDQVWNALSFWLRKPLGAAYEGEDLFFRYMLYRDARQRGLSPDDAVDWATKFIFTYDDLPKGARIIRDFGIPFFSYTFKAVPALAQTALEHPMRFAAPAAVIYGANLMAYALAAGGDDDDWEEVTRKLMTDEAFRAKVSEQEKLERANLPKWNRGRTAMGTQKTIRLGADEATGLPVFLDVSRFIPGGDMLDMENNSGGIDWLPQPLTPSNPVLTTIVAMLYNKDTFLGKDIVDNNDTTGEAARKRGDWLWKQFAPAISVNGYHWTRAMNAAAQASGTTIPWWPQDATGFGKDGLPTQPKYAAMQTFGVKARPVDLDMSEQIEKGQREKMIRELDLEVKRIRRLRNNNAISDEQADEQIELQQTKKERLREGLDVNGKPKD
ncbi:MAG: hypothetical protein EKK53_21630 [Burkholderiales bacterium]|nr:MAG: hypothetical protein EKK53_21630 [Burkholderiales bacterium]